MDSQASKKYLKKALNMKQRKQNKQKSKPGKTVVQEIKYTQSQKRTENIKKFLDINNVILV